RAGAAGLVAVLVGLLSIDLLRKAETDGSIAEILKAGAVYARDDRAQGNPVVTIDLASFMVDDTGRVYRKGYANDPLLTVLPRFEQLRGLNLAHADVTDAGLFNLTHLKALRTLSLRATQITDAGISHLARCVSLDWIDLRETLVTEE